MRKDKVPLILFALSAVFLSYAFGFASASLGWPPHGLLRTSYEQLSDFRHHWRNDLGLEPTRYLVEARGDARPGYDAVDPERMAPGYRLVSGYFKDRSAPNGAVLYDADGVEIHFWPVDYTALDPGGMDPRLVFLHGIDVLPDGSLLVNFDAGDVIARIGACGDVMWSQRGDFHHAVGLSHDGTVWSLEAGRLTQLDAGDGTPLRHIELEDIIERNQAAGVFGMRFLDEEFVRGYMDDPYHSNDIEILSPDMADAFPGFEAGDIMISLRSLNLVAVIGADDLSLKWYQHGPWHRQHDPDFLPDGTISVFDNNMNRGPSRIIRVDPETRRHEVVFEGSEEVPFYTWIRGKHEHLPNGNMLITEPQGGRAFEVDADGRLVWEYRNAFDDRRNLLINKARALPPDYFEPGAFMGCENSLVASNAVAAD